MDTRPFCFQGDHTSNAALANWGVSDASDPLDFPAPEAPTCTQCGGEVWGEAAPAEAQAEGHPGAATQSLATAFRRYKALAAQYDEASWGVLAPEEQARLVAEARGAARQRPGPTRAKLAQMELPRQDQVFGARERKSESERERERERETERDREREREEERQRHLEYLEHLEDIKMSMGGPQGAPQYHQYLSKRYQ